MAEMLKISLTYASDFQGPRTVVHIVKGSTARKLADHMRRLELTPAAKRIAFISFGSIVKADENIDFFEYQTQYACVSYVIVPDESPYGY